MAKKYNNIKNNALKTVAELMCISARTAPKTRGEDNLVIITINKSEKEKIIKQMKKIAKRDSRLSCERDAENIKNVNEIVIIGTKKKVLGLNCGFCGYATCKELSKTKATCVYNSMDLGIALGSCATIASDFHADNRLMFSIGKAAMECGIIDKSVTQAIGIPLAATGKNIFFDRK